MLRTASLSHLTRLQRSYLHHAIASAHEAVAESKRRCEDVVQKSSGDSRDEPVQKIVIDSRTVPVEEVMRVTLLARRTRENVKRVLKDFPAGEERNAKQSTSRNSPVSIHCFSLEVTTSLWSGRRGCLRRWERFDPHHADTFSGSFQKQHWSFRATPGRFLLQQC